MNKVHLLGNLTRDPEVRYTPNGTAVTDASIAVNRTWKNKDGEKQEEVSFIDLQIWNGRGEAFAQHNAKGDPVIIHGRLQQQRWEDKTDGTNRSKLVVQVEDWEFVPSRKRGEDAPQDETPRPKAKPEAKAPAKKATPKPSSDKNLMRGKQGPEVDDDDGDIPF